MDILKSIFLFVFLTFLNSVILLSNGYHSYSYELKQAKGYSTILNKYHNDNSLVKNGFKNSHNKLWQLLTSKGKVVKCDTIYTKLGEKIVVKVGDIGLEIIKYKKCNNLNGPTYSILKSDVKKIIFSNGTIEIYEVENVLNTSKHAYGSIVNARSNTYYVKSDGTIWCSGFMGETQDSKGNNTYNLFISPKQIKEMAQCKQFAAGRYDGKLNHFAVLKNDSTVWTWGRNKRGQLGNGSFESSEIPVSVKSLSGVTQIAAGEEYVIALKGDGTVWAWGRNKYGQLGNKSNIDSNIPVKVNNLENIKYISAGRFNAFAINNEGQVFAWGLNIRGDIDSTTYSNILSPIICEKMNGAIEIQNYLDEVIFLKNDGSVWAFGELTFGDKGVQATKRIKKPIKIIGLENVVKISQGNNFALALKKDGTVWAWGSNRYGQLGDSSLSWHANYDEYAEKKLGGSKFLSVLLMSDNYVEDYFEPFSGSKGLNSFEKPIQVYGLFDIVQIIAGYDVGYAIKKDGTIWAWGDNYYGQLGFGSTRPKYCNVPKKVELIFE